MSSTAQHGHFNSPLDCKSSWDFENGKGRAYLPCFHYCNGGNKADYHELDICIPFKGPCFSLYRVNQLLFTRIDQRESAFRWLFFHELEEQASGLTGLVYFFHLVKCMD